MYGAVQVFWNITPAADSEFESLYGTLTMRDRQSAANIILKVLINENNKIKSVFYKGSNIWLTFVMIPGLR